jgi:hypothetical protein
VEISLLLQSKSRDPSSLRSSQLTVAGHPGCARARIMPSKPTNQSCGALGFFFCASAVPWRNHVDGARIGDGLSEMFVGVDDHEIARPVARHAQTNKRRTRFILHSFFLPYFNKPERAICFPAAIKTRGRRLCREGWLEKFRFTLRRTRSAGQHDYPPQCKRATEL